MAQDQPSPSAPTPRPARRHLATISFGIFGLAASTLSLVVAAWIGFVSFPSAVDETLEPIVAALDRASETASVTARVAACAADEVAAGRDGVLDSVAVQVEAVRAVIGPALGAVRTISTVPGMGSLLPEGILTSLEEADRRLAEVAQDLANPPTGGRVVESIRAGVGELETTAANLDGHSDSLLRFRDAVQTWNVVGTLVVLALILWIATGQLSLVRSGLHHRREHPEVG